MLIVLTAYIVAMISRAPMLLRQSRGNFVPIVPPSNPSRMVARKRLQSKGPGRVYNVAQDRASGEFIIVLSRARLPEL